MLTEAGTRPYIRWLIRRDMPEILAIERASFQSPWGEDDFIRVLRERHCIGMVNELCADVVRGGPIVAYMVYALHEGDLELLNLGVHPDMRRQGVGRVMVEKLIGKLSSHRRRLLTVTVGERNLGGQLFFRSLGFKAVEVMRGHYEDTGDDAFRMEYRLR
jgi:ribosomal-protein-alanine N-acetyltransferase